MPFALFCLETGLTQISNRRASPKVFFAAGWECGVRESKVISALQTGKELVLSFVDNIYPYSAGFPPHIFTVRHLPATVSLVQTIPPPHFDLSTLFASFHLFKYRNGTVVSYWLSSLAVKAVDYIEWFRPTEQALIEAGRDFKHPVEVPDVVGLSSR